MAFKALQCFRPATIRAAPSAAAGNVYRTSPLCRLSSTSSRAHSAIKTVYTNRSYAPIGHYSQAFSANGQIWIAGQVAADVKGDLVKGTVTEQARKICDNINAILEEAGSSMDKVVKVKVYTTDFSVLPEFNAVYNECFAHKPPRTSAEVSRLPLDVTMMVDIIAVL